MSDLGRVVLAHKTDRHLFIKLTFSRKQRPQWEYTEEITEATRFADEHEAERKQREHRIPPRAAIPRDYDISHNDWSNAQQFPPEKHERQNHLGL